MYRIYGLHFTIWVNCLDRRQDNEIAWRSRDQSLGDKVRISSWKTVQYSITKFSGCD